MTTSQSPDALMLELRECQALAIESMRELSAIQRKMGSHLRRKPMHGGAFGSGLYDMSSRAMVLDGLDHVAFLVVESRSGFVICAGATRLEAMAGARRMLMAIDPIQLQVAIGKFAMEVEAEREAARAERESYRSGEREAASKVKSMPRRRRRIFDESGGKCHYCQTPLTLDGRWHIEHKMPRALGGDGKPGNLVASCAPCNHAKRDTTDQEFMAKRGSESP